MSTGNKRLDKIINNISKGNMPHDYYRTGDADNPHKTVDQADFACCRACGQTGSDLEEFCPAGVKVSIVEIKPNAFARSSTFDHMIRDNKIVFRIEYSADNIKLFITNGSDHRIIFSESSRVADDDFTEARIVIGEIIQAHSDE